ncbi:MAG: hypothetical protein H9993_07815, partial [Candidatus Desulfovibrio faecigallinarum]|nr:hypothetical protein [Candidatus Desulfovibrio faecigallinarum]
SYLIHKFKNGEHRFRLKPAHNDILAYTRLFGEESEFIEESNGCCMTSPSAASPGEKGPSPN